MGSLVDNRSESTVRERVLLLVGLVAGAALLGGCGSSAAGAASAGGPTVTVIGLDTMRFNPDAITVKAGEPVTIEFSNAGIIAHDFITRGADKNVNLVSVGGGQRRKGTFLASQPGTYEVVCVQAGHKEAGMVGRIVVTAN